MNRQTKHLARELLQLLPGDALFQRLEERLQGVQERSGAVKCFCPYHESSAEQPAANFRSFLIDLRQKTCRCTITSCPGGRRRDLLQLHAHLADEPLLTILLRLMADSAVFGDKMKLGEEVLLLAERAVRAEFDELTTTLEAEQRTANDKPDTGDELGMLSIDSESPASSSQKGRSAPELAQTIWTLYRTIAPAGAELLPPPLIENQENPAASGENLLALVQQGLADGNLTLAAQALERLEEQSPEAPAAIELKAQLAEAQGERRTAAALFWQYLESGPELPPADESPIGDQLADDSLDDWPAEDEQQSDGDASLDLEQDALTVWLRKILELDPTHAAALERLAEHYAAHDRLEEARKLWARLFQLQLAQKDGEKALLASQRLMESDPADENALRRHARLLADNGRIEEAAQCYLQLAELCLAHEHWQAAEDAYRLILDAQPEKLDVSRKILELLIQQELWERAFLHGERLLALLEEAEQADDQRDLLRQLVQWRPQRTALREKLIRLLERTGQTGLLLQELRALAEVYFERGQREEGMGRLEKARLMAAQDAAALEDLAKDFAKQKEMEQAAQLLLQTGRLVMDADPDQTLALAEHGLKLLPPGESATTVKAIKVLQFEVHRRRGDESAMLELLPVLLADGAAASVGGKVSAINGDQLRTLANDYPEAPAFRLLLIDQLIEENKLNQALAELNGILTNATSADDLRQALKPLLHLREATPGDNTPEGLETLQLLALAYEKLEEPEELIKTLDALWGVHANHAATKEVQEIFTRLAAQKPDDFEVLSRQLGYLLEHEATELARPIFDQLLTAPQKGSDAERVIALGQRLLAQTEDDLKLRRRLAGLLAAADRWDEARTEYEKLCQRYREENPAHPELVACLEAILNHEPEHLAALTELAELAERQGDNQLAGERYGQLAELHRQQNDHAAALIFLTKAQECSPDDLELLLRLAQALEDGGKRARAQEAWEQALARQLEAGAKEQALATLEHLLELSPQREQLHFQLCGLLQELQQPDRAFETLAALAGEYEAAGYPKKALRVLRELIARFPEKREARDRLIDSLGAAGQTNQVREEQEGLIAWLLEADRQEEAAEILEQLRQAGGDDAELSERLGRLYESMERIGRAAEEYERAAHARHQAGAAEQAIALMRQLLELQPHRQELKPVLARWLYENDRLPEAADEMFGCAEQQLAAGQKEAGAELAEELLTWLPADNADRLRAARLLDEHEQGERAAQLFLKFAQTAQAAHDYERTIDACTQGFSSDDSRFALLSTKAEAEQALGRLEEGCETYCQLARLLLAAGHSDEAVNAFEAAADLTPNRPETLEELVQVLLELKRTEDAAPLLHRLLALYEQDKHRPALIACRRRLAELEPQDLANRRLLALALNDAGESAPARELLQPLLTEALELEELEVAQEVLGLMQQWLPAKASVDERGQLLKVEIELHQQLHNDEKAAELLRKLGDLWFDSDRKEEAVELYQQLLKETPQDEELFGKCKVLLRQLGKTTLCLELLEERIATVLAASHPPDRAALEQALALRRELVAARPSDLKERERLADALVQLEQTAEAAECLIACMDLAAKGNDEERACSFGQRALELDEWSRPARERLAAIHEQQGDAEQAFELLAPLIALAHSTGELEKALGEQHRLIERFPDLVTPRETLSQWLRESGRAAEALGALLGIYELYLRRGEEAKATFGLEDRLVECCGDSTDLLAQLLDWLLKHERKERAESILLRQLETAEQPGESQEATQAFRDCAQLAYRFLPESIALHQRIFAAECARGAIDETLRCGELLGELLAGAERSNEAEKVYRQLPELAPDQPKCHEALIEFLVRQKRPEEAIAQRKTLLALLGEQERAEEELVCCERLLALAPEDEETLLRKARLLQDLEQTSSGVELLTTLAQQRREEKRWDEAMRLQKAAHELAPDDVGVLRCLIEDADRLPEQPISLTHRRILADVFEQAGKLEEAIGLYDELLKRQPEESELYNKLADLALRDGDPERASAALTKLARQYEGRQQTELAIAVRLRLQVLAPDSAENFKALGRCFKESGNIAKALNAHQSCLELLKEKKERAAAIDLLREMLELKQSRTEFYDELIQLLDDDKRPQDANQERMLLAELLFGGDTGSEMRAVKVLRQITDDDPAYPQVVERLADYFQAQGDARQAVQEYVKLVAYYESRKALHEAATTCLKILSVEGEHLDSHQKLFMFYRNINEPDLLLGEALWLGNWAMAAGDPIYAEECLLQAEQVAPQQVKVRMMLAELYLSQQRDSEALQLLNEQIAAARAQNEKDHLEACFALAAKCRPDDVGILHAHLAELLHDDRADQARTLYLKTADQLLEKNRLREMEGLRQLCLQLFPDDQRLRVELAEVYEEHQLLEEAAAILLEQSEALFGQEQWEESAELCARILVHNPRMPSACARLVAALEELGDKERLTSVLPLMSELYQEDERLPEALAATRRLLELQPESLEVHERLAALCSLAGSIDEENSALEQLVELCLKTGKTERVLDHLKRLLVIAPQNTAAREKYIELARQVEAEEQLLGHCMILLEQFIEHERPEKVREYFALALEIAPDDLPLRERQLRYLIDHQQPNDAEALAAAVEEALTVARLQLKQNHPKKALSFLQEATSFAPKHAQLYQLMGEIYLRINYKGRALESLRQAAQLLEEQQADQEMQQVHRMILEFDPQDAESQVKLIESLFRGKRHDEAVERSLELADAYLNRQLPDLAETAYQRILQYQPHNLSVWRKLIEVHELLGNKEELAKDYSLMADYFQGEGRLEDALSMLRKTLKLDPMNIEVRRRSIELQLAFTDEKELLSDYALLARALEEHNLDDDAAALYRRILKIDPQHQAAAAALATLKQQSTAVRNASATATGQRSNLPSGYDVEASRLELKKAIQTCQLIIAKNPDNAEAHHRLGDCYKQTGQMNKALEEWDVASQLFFDQVRFTEAVRLCETLLTYLPHSGVVRERLRQSQVQADFHRAMDSAFDGPND